MGRAVARLPLGSLLFLEGLCMWGYRTPGGGGRPLNCLVTTCMFQEGVFDDRKPIQRG